MIRISKKIDFSHKITARRTDPLTIQQRAAAYLAQCILLLSRMDHPEADAISGQLRPYIAEIESIQPEAFPAFQSSGLILARVAWRA